MKECKYLRIEIINNSRKDLEFFRFLNLYLSKKNEEIGG